MIKNNSLLSLIITSLIVFTIFSGCLPTNVPVKEKTTEEETTKEIEETKETKLTGSGKIIFTSERNGNSEIYVMNIDGSGLKNLTNNPADDGGPVCSPDGKKILFTSLRDHPNYEMYIMNADGTEQKMLTKGLDISINWGPSYDWSPDGKKIVFTYWVGDHKGNEEIYIMNVDGSQQKRLTNSPHDDWGPRWSPDGKKIIFGSWRDKNNEIYVMNSDGTEQKRLTNNPTDDGGYEWTPDGKKILFKRDLGEDYDIYIMNADGSKQIKLTDNPFSDTSPDLSPDGTKIIFESVTVYDEENEISSSDIFIMNIDGSKQTNLTNTSDKSEFRPIWSPDGTKIAFCCMDEDGNYEVYVMNADGSELKNLTNNPARDWIGDWKP